MTRTRSLAGGVLPRWTEADELGGGVAAGGRRAWRRSRCRRRTSLAAESLQETDAAAAGSAQQAGVVEQRGDEDDLKQRPRRESRRRWSSVARLLLAAVGRRGVGLQGGILRRGAVHGIAPLPTWLRWDCCRTNEEEDKGRWSWTNGPLGAAGSKGSKPEEREADHFSSF
jgi:hypothetical protein